MWDIMAKYGIPSKILGIIKAMYEGYECQVVHDGVLSESFHIHSGVKQGCVLSPTLFIIVLDAVMWGAVGGRKRGIQWTLNERLEDLDFADDLCLISQRFTDLQAKLSALDIAAAGVGLRINSSKTKEMRIKARTDQPLVLRVANVERVDSFFYLGSVVTEEGGSDQDVRTRIRKANGAFVQLYPVWKSGHISRRTKLRIFNTNVKSVLLYGCETWKVSVAITKRLQVFVNRCLRRIMKIWWPETIRNEELWQLTEQEHIGTEILRRKWRWIGHTLRREDAIEKDALEWNPQGERRQGRPRISWRRSVEKEARLMGRTWGEVKRLAPDRDGWKRFVEALCSSRSHRN
ncbi:hypothetical protein GE061_019984 [Apolygus lucorum]|uniref:Uncharacterized protein n=1 Tax=Apolygus lucorum TaxID=248454 RepID=A0A6A4JIB4_APOLU|nr:hypothetical protein GE061_019984 [Apolygus lucorum]